MGPHLRELIRRVTAGELSDAAAKQVIADARKVVDAEHQAFLDDLSAIVVAEKALAKRSEPHRRDPSAVQI
jgi:hypothetical protein